MKIKKEIQNRGKLVKRGVKQGKKYEKTKKLREKSITAYHHRCMQQIMRSERQREQRKLSASPSPNPQKNRQYTKKNSFPVSFPRYQPLSLSRKYDCEGR